MLIGICDDIEKDCLAIAAICKELGQNDTVLFSTSEELLNYEHLENMDLLFLDIELKGDTRNGIDIKNILEQRSATTFIAFCTTHEELMPEAFGYNVISFLNKPFSKQSIKLCIERASFMKKDHYIFTINEKDSVMSKDILYLCSEQKYTVFYTVDNNSYSSRKPLKKWATELEDLGFCAISRSAIINLKHYVTQKNHFVYLHHNIKLPISRRYVTSLKEHIHSYQIHILRNK